MTPKQVLQAAIDLGNHFHEVPFTPQQLSQWAAEALATLDLPLFVVTWQSPNEDVNTVVRARTASEALQAACPEDHRLIEHANFEFVTDACVYVHKDIPDSEIPEHDPTDSDSVTLCGAVETTILEANPENA